MDTSQAVQYVRQRRAAGTPDAVIRQELFASGWQSQWVERIFAEADGRLQPAAQYNPSNGPTQFLERFNLKKMAIIVGVVLVLLVIAIAATLPSLKKQSNKTPTTSTSEPSDAADVERLVASVTDYINNNAASLPEAVKITGKHDIMFCNAECGVATYISSATYDFDVSGVQIQTYSKNMAVAKASDIYLVASATCNSDNTTAIQSTASSMAFIYSVVSGIGTKQVCANT
jgi:type II secretory pathway pseudopilin PulG